MGPARALLLSMVLLRETLHPGLHTGVPQLLWFKMCTSAEHLVADSLPTLTVKNNLILELSLVQLLVYLLNP